MSKGARSRYGCWTCRLRKKKCDERRPSCSPCVSLELRCHGDKSKPPWMDGGELEKQKSAEVKHIVKQTLAKRRLRYSDPQNVGDESRALAGISTKRLSDSMHALPCPITGDPPQPHHIANTSPELYEFPLTDQGALELSDHTWIGAQDFSGLATDYSLDTEMGGSFSYSSDPSRPESDQLDEPLTLWPVTATISRQHLAAGNEEGGLLMCYLDQVFYIQFPYFDQSSRNGVRGWLFRHLMQVRWLYDSAIALAGVYQESLQHRNGHESSNVSHGKNTEGYHNSALQGLQLSLGGSHMWTGGAGLTNALQALICVIQLLYFEVFKGGTGDWQMHLRAAASMTLLFVKGSTISVTLDAPDPKSIEEEMDQIPSPQEDHSIVAFVLTAVLWFDVLACASAGSEPFLQLDHEALLQNDQIRTVDLVGCEGWPLLLIFKISKLFSWKKEQERAHKLSVAELAKRAARIEEHLKIKVDELLTREEPRQESSSEKVLQHFSRSNSVEITRVFALAAFTYLHVVVSGANSELPEIVESVSDTLTALKSLTDQTMLRFLVWPFCITGCLALKEQQSDFRALISASGVDEHTVGTLLQSFKIMEECWRLKENGSRSCDWTFAMNSLGYRVLLI